MYKIKELLPALPANFASKRVQKKKKKKKKKKNTIPPCSDCTPPAVTFIGGAGRRGPPSRSHETVRAGCAHGGGGGDGDGDDNDDGRRPRRRDVA